MDGRMHLFDPNGRHNIQLLHEFYFEGIAITEESHPGGLQEGVGFSHGRECGLLAQPANDREYSLSRLGAAKPLSLAHFADDSGVLQDTRR